MRSIIYDTVWPPWIAGRCLFNVGLLRCDFFLWYPKFFWEIARVLIFKCGQLYFSKKNPRSGNILRNCLRKWGNMVLIYIKFHFTTIMTPPWFHFTRKMTPPPKSILPGYWPPLNTPPPPPYKYGPLPKPIPHRKPCEMHIMMQQSLFSVSSKHLTN